MYTHIKHTLELNDVIIAASLLEKHNHTYRLVSFIHERELKRPQYCYDVVQDALLDFCKSLENGKQRRMAVLLEHDRASEHINAFKQRIRAYVRVLKAGVHKHLYRVGAVTMAVTTSKGGVLCGEVTEVDKKGVVINWRSANVRAYALLY